jgi:hypothetical protein
MPSFTVEFIVDPFMTTAADEFEVIFAYANPRVMDIGFG